MNNVFAKVWDILCWVIYGPHAARLRAMTDGQLASRKASLVVSFKQSAVANRYGSSHGLWVAESRIIRASVADIAEEQLRRQLKRERAKIRWKISTLRRRHAMA